MIYNTIVEDCFFHPRHVGDLEPRDGLSLVTEQLDRAGERLWLGCLLDSDKIIKAQFKAQGSPYTIAALEWLCRETEGKKRDAIMPVDYQKLVDLLAISDTNYPAALRVSDLFNALVEKIHRNRGQ